MGLAFLITSENLQILSERKVLKQSEYSALLDAGSLLSTAQAERQRMLDEAQQGYERRLREGHAQGVEQGKREYAEQACGAALDAARTLDGLRDTIAGIVVKAVRTIVGESDPHVLYEAALRRIDALVRDEAFLVVRVAPTRRDAVAAALQQVWPERMAAGAGTASPIRIVTDSRLSEEQCIVETPSGTLDVGLDAQIDALRAAIRQRTS
ncbi:type III secretion system stator protein SctL [Paraburkholderia strydomiana]|jgi:type III secretion protein L|uniref:Type 3 secretion system stator protein n=1 Tax=Paraburkholderia strydomiana TaxID=1245417 RepID=A0ABW9EDY3_9BURK